METQTPEELAAEQTRQHEATLAAVQGGMKAERERSAGIRQAVALAGLPETLTNELIESGTTLEAARVRVFAEMAAKAAANPQTGNVAITRDNRDTFRAQVEAGILLRADPSRATAEERSMGRDFAGLSLVEVAR